MNTCTAWLALALLAADVAAYPQQEPKKEEQATQAQPAAQAASASTEKLEQIVAPIALYPDALLAQIMMASTYPLEIVEAARWVQQNPKVTGDKLEAALKDQTWDPSVKSLCGFPDVVKRMNDNLDWTQDLGDAFLAQKAELMECVQTMRRKAYEAGNLKSSKEITVTEQSDTIIIIENADPEVIYVPTYYPTAVYGSWTYPYWYYPPMYPYPPAGGAWFGFSVGVVWGAAIWGDCDWNDNDVNIDIDNQNNFIDRTENTDRRQEVKDRARTSDRAGNKAGFKHDPSHRKGVGYKDSKVAQKYGAGPGQSRVSKDQARGYGDRAGTSQRPATGDRATAAGARDVSSRPAGGREATQRPSTSSRSTGQRTSSFSGSRSPSLDRASSSRGASSRGSRGGGGFRGGRR